MVSVLFILVVLSTALLISTATSYHLYISRTKSFIPIEKHLQDIGRVRNESDASIANVQRERDRLREDARHFATKLDECHKNVNGQAEKLAEIKLSMWRDKEERRIREDAIKRSSNTVKGKVSEHLAPFKLDFAYSPRDCRFIGTPIDYVIFAGLEHDKVEEVVFLEVKTGEFAKLTQRERSVRDAIQAGKVRWEVLEINPD